jgi:DnaJ-like protein
MMERFERLELLERLENLELVLMAIKRSSQPTGAVGFIERLAEQRILEAQRNGEFDDLAGKGKPLQLEDQSSIPEELRMAYHVLKNAKVLPPEAELLKDIRILEDLLKHVEDEGERRSLAKSLQWKVIRLEMLKRRSMDLATVRDYGRKIVAKFYRR